MELASTLALMSYFFSKHIELNQAWWITPVSPELMRLRREGPKFQASLCYTGKSLFLSYAQKVRLKLGVSVFVALLYHLLLVLFLF
jgi:hypothetical protein